MMKKKLTHPILVLIAACSLFVMSACEDIQNTIKVNKGIASCEMIQEAFENYKYQSDGGYYPGGGDMPISWPSLGEIVNSHGGDLADTEEEQGILFYTYDTWDVDRDGYVGDDYYFIFRVIDVPNDFLGSQLKLTPNDGVEKQTWED